MSECTCAKKQSVPQSSHLHRKAQSRHITLFTTLEFPERFVTFFAMPFIAATNPLMVDLTFENIKNL